MSNDIYTIEPTGRTVCTRHGDKPQYALRRNGVVVCTSTQRDCEAEKHARETSGRNPLAGIGGQFA